MRLPKRLNAPAVFTAAFCDPRAMATPLFAAAPHGVDVSSRRTGLRS